jgi:hypothetical protein
MTASYQMSKQYNLDLDLLFAKCQEAIEICAFSHQESNKSNRYIKAKVGTSMKSFGEEIELEINQNGIVNVRSTCSSFQFVDYGKNRENLERLFNVLDILVRSVSGNCDKSEVLANSRNKVQLIRDIRLGEYAEIIATEEIPLDNRFGSQELSVGHEFSKTVCNEVTLETNQGTGGKGNLDLFHLIKAEISRTSSQKQGLSVGESLTRRFNLTFSVKPGDFVIYKIIWKRRVINAEYHVMYNHDALIVPYNLQVGLEYEVSTELVNRA